MLSMAAGAYLPVVHGTSADGSWILALVAIALLAIGITVLLALNSRPAKTTPSAKETPADTYRKAA
jgi:hypothetical protein